MAVFDVEADGLLEEATKLHVLSYQPLGSTEVHSVHHYDDMREFLTTEKVLIGHNIYRYDVPLLEKLLNIEIKAKLYDTLPMSWYLNTNRLKHGLDSFGDDYGIPKPKITDWEGLTREEYTHRCQEDVKINMALWNDLIKRLLFLYKDRTALEKFLGYLMFKMKCASTQEALGWPVDTVAVLKHIETLTAQQKEKKTELVKVMPKHKVYKIAKPPKVLFKKDGTASVAGQGWFDVLDQEGLDRTHQEDVRVFKEEVDPNPQSSDQVKDWLYGLGWEPCTFDYKKDDKTGDERKVPQVRKDGELTESVKLLIEKDQSVGVLDGLTVIQHRLSIFEAFRDMEVDGKLKAEIAGLTNTLRFKHSKPLVNLPGVDKPWGKEIRGCLIAPEGHVLCGADMVSLEDTTKRHYVKPLDPTLVEEQTRDDYDPHLKLAVVAGMLSQEDYDFYVSYKKEG